MIYVTKKCKRCGFKVQNRSSRSRFYGSPLRQCPNCGTNYFDGDYIEAALVEDTFIYHVVEIFKGLISNAIFSFGIAFVINIFINNIDYLPSIYLGVYITILLIHIYIEFFKTGALHRTEIEESLARLENKQYLDFLIKNGYEIGKNSPYEIKQKEKDISYKVESESVIETEELRLSNEDNFDYKKLYQSLNSEISKVVFKEGFDEFLSVLQSLKRMLSNEYSYKELIKIYVMVWTSLEKNDPHKVIEIMKSQYDSKDINKKASIIISYVLTQKKDNKIEVIEDESVSYVNSLSEADAINKDIESVEYKKLYESLNPELSSVIFPFGYKDFKAILNSMRYLFGRKYSSADLAKIYAKNWTRTEQADADEIVRRIKLSNELKDDEDKLDLLVAFILIHKKNSDFEIKDNETFTVTKMLAESFSERIRLKKINDNKITKFVKDEDYGKVIHKPIYTNGFKGSEIFLKNLRFKNGERLRYKRKGSIASDSGSVDIYEIENEQTLEKDTIYINLYSNNDKFFPPNGYSLVSLDNSEVDLGSNKQESKNKAQNIHPKFEIQEPFEAGVETCLKCNHKNPIESRFCSNCGSEILAKVYCEKCGSKIKENSKYCHMCGSRV